MRESLRMCENNVEARKMICDHEHGCKMSREATAAD